MRKNYQRTLKKRERIRTSASIPKSNSKQCSKLIRGNKDTELRGREASDWEDPIN